ncbi:Acetyltransferase (GNAT) family protein [Halobiforma haloterrestris]|uniref:Acetyltransferase (GNAT) family protein n=1 Tax=Natronobacterium haloterrestre TaxID=148448 RepID=A0A1I1CYN0_NATHA|nr:GNAT family N-acetyltransferase [Halobiforma haloterrestris]SFB67859.1 Acetyltransferase (GNAT) family protein [Halobiforma haloterrestris]
MTTDTCPAWDPADCEGTTGCPPRCPRFIDKRGEPILVEPYDGDRFEGLVSMYVDYPEVHRSMGVPPVTREHIENWLERLIDRGYNVVAAHEDEIVGHAAYSPCSSLEPQFVVFVDPAYHERGIGSELCRHVIARAADNGHEALVLDVDGDNERAIHVYRRMGFETVDRSGNDLRMRLSFDEPIVETVQLPPAERPANA